jgi:myo-inositol 2-dehydrogenase/D-chiro-inositol 1-dehydrogenase
MTAIRIGFAGAGYIAGVHARLLARDPRVRVQALFDPDTARAEALALQSGASIAPSIDALLGDIDCLYICNPNAGHADLALRALAAGLHVFCEKPMATSLEAATAVRDAVRASGRVYHVGFNRRFAPVYRDLKTLIDSGALTPASVAMKMNRGELQHPAWTGDPASTGGYLYETPVHMLDMMRFLFGEPREVVCRARAAVSDELDDFSMLFVFDSGASAVLASSAHATWLYPFERIEVFGAHCAAVTEEMQRLTWCPALGAVASMSEYAQLPLEERWGYATEDAAFIDALCGAGPPPVTAEDAWLTTALVDRCYEAARAAQP